WVWGGGEGVVGGRAGISVRRGLGELVPESGATRFHRSIAKRDAVLRSLPSPSRGRENSTSPRSRALVFRRPRRVFMLVATLRGVTGDIETKMGRPLSPAESATYARACHLSRTAEQRGALRGGEHAEWPRSRTATGLRQL